MTSKHDLKTRFICALLALAFVIATPTPAHAQVAEAQRALGEVRKGGPRKQLATIIFAGLGGAILGLSTLSFYGRPQDQLRNIGIGFAVGIFAGTAYVTYKAATNPQELYGWQNPRELPYEINQRQNEWRLVGQSPTPPPLTFGYTFEF